MKVIGKITYNLFVIEYKKKYYLVSSPQMFFTCEKVIKNEQRITKIIHNTIFTVKGKVCEAGLSGENQIVFAELKKVIPIIKDDLTEKLVAMAEDSNYVNWKFINDIDKVISWKGVENNKLVNYEDQDLSYIEYLDRWGKMQKAAMIVSRGEGFNMYFYPVNPWVIKVAKVLGEM